MRSLVRQFWVLGGSYWRSEERFKSGAILLAVIALQLGAVYITVLINFWYAQFYNALQERDFAAFSSQILRFGGLAAIYIFARVYSVYLRQMLQIRWRNWLTRRYVARWLQNDAYYHLQLSSKGADNPDQRIQEDIGAFAGQTLILGLGLMDSIVTLASFAAILWWLSGTLEVAGLAIPGYMLWAAILYAAAGTWLTIRIGKPLIALNYQQQKFEANLRFSLVRLRENAEGIALYAGEKTEFDGVASRFANVVSNWRGIMHRQKLLGWFSSGYAQAAIIFPFVVAAPRYFSAAFELGQLIQTAQAFGQVQSALSWFVSSYTDVAEWKATVNRLSGFEEALAKTAGLRAKGLTFKELPGAAGLTVSHVNIYLPGGAPLLIDVSLELPARSRVLISGSSGIGKSTFLRTLAGIWPYCEGGITLPAGERTLFLPQKPYLPLGTLRDTLCYPDTPGKHGEKAVRAVLTSCGLTAFARRLDEKENWALQLSLGEQQRIAFARALLVRPQWLFLDEATSALDEEAEAVLYALILESIKYCSIISVAHRSSLVRFHDRQLIFSSGIGIASARIAPIDLTAGFGRGAA